MEPQPTELLTPPPEEPPPRRELWPWLLVLALLVIAGLAALWYATRDSGAASKSPVTLQRTVAAAPAKARPKPKKRTPTTTSTAAQVAVPDLVGQKHDDATRTLEAAGLKSAVAEVPSDQDKNLVVAQDPSGGARVDKGSSVTLNISKGKPPVKPQPVTVTVPDVVGESQAAAVHAVTSAGLKPSKQHVPSTQEKGTVVSQSPSGGSSTQKGAGVLLNISDGPPRADHPAKTKPAKPQQPATETVPGVTGETEASATSDLEAAGFSVSSVAQATNDPSMDGVVIDQSPPDGSDAAPGSSVTIYVGRYSTG